VRVLFAESEYPYMHGSFLETAVRAAVAAGVDVHVWSANAKSEHPYPLVAPLHTNEPLSATIDRVRPDIVHSHYLDLAARLKAEVASRGVLYTVRMHGCDYQQALLNRMAADPAIAHIFVFPHYADDVDPANREKVSVLPTMYNPQFYGLEPGRTRETDSKLVLRGVAGSDRKNIAHFLEAAALCPGYRFVLIMGCAYPVNRPPVAGIEALNERMGRPVEIRKNLDWPAMAALMRRAAMYMYTPPNHPSGMSISVAESMACGCLVLGPDIRGMEAYLGESGGRVYRNPAEAAEIVRSTAAWSEADWRRTAERSSAYAKRHYAMNVVGPKLVAAWRKLIGEAEPAPRRSVAKLWRRITSRRLERV
jgi:glycosyltransferase involved in cell wall biosynthesis